MRLTFFRNVNASRSQIEAFLKKQGPNAAHPWGDRLLVWTGSGFDERPVENDVSRLINSVSTSSLESSLPREMAKHPSLSSIRNFTVQIVDPGTKFCIPHSDPEKIKMFVVTNKIGQYFDFVVYGSNKQLVSYHQKACKPFNHSGDIGSLLHYVKIDSRARAGLEFALTVVGYNLTPLHRFQNQVPVVIVVNYVTETLLVIPCPLDRATVGDSCMAILATGAICRNGVCEYTALSSPIMCGSVNTGDISKQTRSRVNEAFEAVKNVRNMDDDSAGLVLGDASAEGMQKTIPVGLLQNTCSVYVENGLKPLFSLANPAYIHFALSIDVAAEFTARPKEPHNLLPVSSAGASLLQKGKQNGYFVDDTFSVFHVTENYLDSIARTPTEVINGLFIIHSDQTNFDNIKINCLAAAGPLSIVLIYRNNKLFFFRGVRWPGVLDTLPEVGSDVTEMFTDRSLSNIVFPWPFKVGKNAKAVYFNSAMMTPNEAIDMLSSYSFDKVVESEADIIDLTTQLSVLLTQEKLKILISKFSVNMEKMIKGCVEKDRVQLRKFVAENQGDADFAKKLGIMAGKVKGKERQTRKKVQSILNRFGKAVSVRGVSSRAQVSARTLAVAANVSAASNATLDEKCAALEDISTILGILVGNIDSDASEPLLRAIEDGNFLAVLERQATPLLEVNPRTRNLDALTYGCLLELDSNHDHPFYSQTGLALPQDVSSALSSLPFVMIDQFVTMADPSSVSWPVITNDPKIAMFRILWRATIVQATCSRTLHLNPASKDLGYFMAHCILAMMENIVSRLSQVPDFDDTTAQFLRGLFGLLLTCLASGSTPLSRLYKFVYEKTTVDVPMAGEWRLLFRMMEMFPYTAWKSDAFKSNMKSLVVRFLRLKLTDPVTSKIRDGQFKAEQSKGFVEARNDELQWLAVAVKVIVDMTSDTSPEVSQRVLSIFPVASSSTGGARQLKQFFRDHAAGDVNNFEGYHRTVYKTALDIYSKRSATFRKIKTRMVKALDTSEEGELATLDDRLRRRIKTLDKRYGFEARVQNADMFFAHDIQLKGDGELSRYPFTLDHSFDSVKYENEVAWVLKGGELQAGAPATLAKFPTGLAADLAKLPHSDNAVALAKSYRSLSVADISGLAGTSHFTRLVVETGVTLDELHEVIKILLVGWQDPVAAEGTAEKMLMP